MQRATLIASALLLFIAKGVSAQSSSDAKAAPSTRMTPPVAISTPEPIYPPNVRERGIRGVVVVGIVVAADGTVQDPKVLRKVGFGLDEAALEAVKSWRFRPAMKEGTPVASKVNVEVAFRDPNADLTYVNGEKIYDVSKGIRAPKMIEPCYPDFTSSAATSKLKKIKGTVRLSVVVDADGTVLHIKVIEGLGTDINQVVVNTVGTCKFEPGVREKDGQPIVVRVPIAFNFNVG